MHSALIPRLAASAKRGRRNAARAAVLAAGCLLSASAPAEELAGRVIGVLDGDTVILLDARKIQHRVRLAGIDAPEWGQRSRFRSKENLSRLVYERDVQAECRSVDLYGRKVCTLRAGATDVGLEQVRAGYAWWYRAYAGEQSREDRGAYERAEAQARQAQLGLWKEKNPVPPWEWRSRR